MKRREDIAPEAKNQDPVVNDSNLNNEPEVKLEDLEPTETEKEGIKVVNNKLVDENGFAISDSEITDESETSDLFIEVDGYRQKYIKSAKFFKYFNIGVMVFLLIAVVTATAFLTKKELNQTVSIVLIVVIVLLLIGIFVYNVLVKRHLNSKAVEYVEKYYETTTRYMLSSEEFSLVTINPKGKVDKEFFNNARFYKDIQGIGSRNVVSFKYNNREMTFVDLAAQVQGVKKLEPIFVGKVLKVKLDKEVNGRLVAQIKGNSKLTKPIDDIEGLDKIASSGNYIVYSNMNKGKTYLTKSITDLFGKYKLNNDLLDVIISIHGDEVVIGLDYNDHVMQLPVDKKFNKKQIDDIKEALLNSIKIAEAFINKPGE